ncbi:unnamed protein product [Rotaria magnacalcarata]
MNQDSTDVSFFHSTNNGVDIRHFIFTKNGTDAAKMWNSQSIDGIMNILQTATDARRNLKVITEMINFVNAKLPQLFTNTHDDNSSENNQKRLQIQMHVRKPFIVLSHRKDMENLEHDPYPLSLSPKLLYDDAGYFIGISSMDNGEWKPLYNLYETEDEILAIVELAGFKQGDTRVGVGEESITIEGQRVNFKESLSNPTAHQEKIPMGKFKLEIPFKCRIDQDRVTLEYNEGLYKFTIPKKKATVKYL